MIVQNEITSREGLAYKTDNRISHISMTVSYKHRTGRILVQIK